MRLVSLFVAPLLLITASCAEQAGSSAAPSSGMMTRVGAQASIDECANGGVVLEYGIDENQNGNLDDTEVDGTVAVCHGNTGANGHDALIEVEGEPMGDNCSLGGNVIKSGIDANDDGVLDPDEVTNTQYICESGPVGVLEGTVYIRNARDVALLSQVTEITGALGISAKGLSHIRLPVLQRVGGYIEFQADETLISFDFPMLTAVDGSLQIGGLARTVNLVGLSSLVSVGDGLIISGCTSLTTLEGLENLATVGGLSIGSGNTSLRRFASFDNLTTIERYLHIESNNALTELDLPVLHTVGSGFSVQDNASLATCEAERLFAQLVDFNGTSTISGNDDAGSCF